MWTLVSVVFCHTQNWETMRKRRTINTPGGPDFPSLVWATFAWQRQAELLYARWGASRASSPADYVWVISFKQSLPLLGTGQLKKPLASFIVSRCSGDGPAHQALCLELRVHMFRGCKDKIILWNSTQHKARWDQTLADGWADLLASSSVWADALLGMWVLGAGLKLVSEPTKSSLLFGSASWQILGVATAVCVALFSYHQISGHGWWRWWWWWWWWSVNFDDCFLKVQTSYLLSRRCEASCLAHTVYFLC